MVKSYKIVLFVSFNIFIGLGIYYLKMSIYAEVLNKQVTTKFLNIDIFKCLRISFLKLTLISKIVISFYLLLILCWWEIPSFDEELHPILWMQAATHCGLFQLKLSGSSLKFLLSVDSRHQLLGFLSVKKKSFLIPYCNFSYLILNTFLLAN